MSRPLAFTRRFDQLGGRLSALIDAMAIAKVHDFDFAFVWRDSPASISDPRQLFSDSFLAAHRIHESDLASRLIIPGDDLDAALNEIAVRRASGDTTALALEIDNPFGVWVERNAQGVTARAEFVDCFGEIGWSDPVASVMTSCASLKRRGPMTAIHIRAGDIVTGGWRHIMAHEKYTPTPFVLDALNRSTTHDAVTVVMSDHPQLLKWLSNLYPTVLTPQQVVPGYSSLSELQRAFADLYVMSSCTRIECPPRSAFSGLASLIGGAEIHRLDESHASENQREFLLDAIHSLERQCEQFEFLDALVARDICWCIDVFGEDLSADQTLELARRAVAHDGEFAGAHARLGRVLAMSGGLAESARELEIAFERTSSTDIHCDPEFEALASMILLESVACVGDGASSAHSTSTPRAARVRELRSQCRDLPPYQLSYSDALFTMEFMEAMLTWIESLTARRRRRIDSAARVVSIDSIDTTLYREPALALHRRAGSTFDPVTRDLERVAIWLSVVVSRSRPSRRRPQRVATGLRSSASSSGLTWARGVSSTTRRATNRLRLSPDQLGVAVVAPSWNSWSQPSDADVAVPVERAVASDPSRLLRSECDVLT